MISFIEFFNGNTLEEEEDDIKVNIKGTEDGEEKNFTATLDSDNEADAEDEAEDKLDDMKDDGSVPDDATIQNLEK